MRYLFLYGIFFWLGMTTVHGQPFTHKRVLYLNSYHAGYSSSDSVMAAIKEAFDKKKNILLQTFFLNAKKENDAPSINKNVQLFLKQYDAFQPDLLIVSDDDAMREIVVPFVLKNFIPVVFCGINWSADEYHLQTTTAGMLEVLPIESLFREMKMRYPAAKRVTVLSESSPVEKKNTLYLNPIFKKLNLAATYELVNDFATWKIKFEDANKLSDIIYLPTNGTIKGWDVEEAKNFIKATIKKPVVTCDDFMMPYAVYGETKIAREQGEWAAATALAILSGKAPERIGVTQNRLSKRWLNQALATRIGFIPDRKFFKNLNLVSK